MEYQYIRHLTEDGEWQYSNVKSVGELSLLTTNNKEDLVSAINEINRYFSIDLEAVKDLLEGIEDIENTIKDMTDLVVLEKEKIEKISQDMTVKATELETKVNQTETKLTKKISASETDIANLKLRASTIEKNLSSKGKELDGKIVAIEKELVETNEEISTKLSKTEYDENVGVDKWISTFYPSNKDLSNLYPKIEDMNGISPSYVEEQVDSVVLYPFTESKNGILHLYTNVYMKQAKTFGLSIDHSHSMSVLMNGAYVYYRDGSRVGNISFSLRAGWNTIEILMAVNGVGSYASNIKVSDLVDKMTTTIGVGSKNESRMTYNETLLKQTNDSILLKADKTLVENLGNRVEEQSARLQVQSNEISSKVGKQEFSEYTKRLETAETSIVQTSESIKSLATKSEVDTLNGFVSEQQTSINQLSNRIELVASDESLNELEQRVAIAESKITLNSDSILTKVSQTDFDKEAKKISEHQTSINQLKDSISLKAEKTEVDKVTGIVGNLESELLIQAGEISSKASSTELDTVRGIISSMQTSITQNTNNISLKANSSTVDAINKRVANAEAELNVQADMISSKVSLEEFDNMENRVKSAESEIIQQTEAISLKASRNELDIVEERIGLAEAELIVQSDAITSKVSKTEFDSLNRALQTASTRIEQTEESISSMATIESVNAISGNASKALSVANQTAKELSSKVSYEEMGETVESSVTQTFNTISANLVRNDDIITSINASLEGVKIKGERVEIEGLVTFKALSKDVSNALTDAVELSESAFETAETVSDRADNALSQAEEALEATQTFADMIDGAIETSESAWDEAYKASSRILDWTSTNTTQINGAKIRTGTVTADRIVTGAIDGQTITGATFRTSANATKGGLIMNSTGIKGYDSSGTLKTELSTSGLLRATDAHLENAYISGEIHAGGKSTFSGVLNTENDVYVGRNLYMLYKDSSGLYDKAIVFSASGTNTSNYRTAIMSSELGLKVKAWTALELDSKWLDVYNQQTNIHAPTWFTYAGENLDEWDISQPYALHVPNHPAYFGKGFTVGGGIVDFTSATVKGVTAVFG